MQGYIRPTQEHNCNNARRLVKSYSLGTMATIDCNVHHLEHLSPPLLAPAALLCADKHDDSTNLHPSASRDFIGCSRVPYTYIHVPTFHLPVTPPLLLLPSPLHPSFFPSLPTATHTARWPLSTPLHHNVWGLQQTISGPVSLLWRCSDHAAGCDQHQSRQPARRSHSSSISTAVMVLYAELLTFFLGAFAGVAVLLLIEYWLLAKYWQTLRPVTDSEVTRGCERSPLRQPFGLQYCCCADYFPMCCQHCFYRG